jgi:hypothetical protein
VMLVDGSPAGSTTVTVGPHDSVVARISSGADYGAGTHTVSFTASGKSADADDVLVTCETPMALAIGAAYGVSGGGPAAAGTAHSGSPTA